MNLPRGGIWVRSTALLDMARHAEVALNTYLLKDNARESQNMIDQKKDRILLPILPYYLCSLSEAERWPDLQLISPPYILFGHRPLGCAQPPPRRSQ